MDKKTRASNGKGHTYKNGNSYRTVIKQKGVVVTASAKSVQESRRLAREKLQKKMNASLTQPVTSEKLRLKEFLFDWLENEHQHNIAHSTYRRYHSLARCFIAPILGDEYLTAINPLKIGKMLSVMRSEGQSARSMQQARALLSICLDHAESVELIQSNPVRKVKNPQVKPKPVSPLTIEEVKRLLETYKGTFMGARLHVALVCGLRQGEALGLTWSDIDLENGLIHLNRQAQRVGSETKFVPLKTVRSQRTVVLAEESVHSLRILRNLQTSHRLVIGPKDENELVFPGSDGSFKSSQEDYRDWQKALKLCGIPSKRLHDARHTAATLMYSQGVGIETISRALGHSSSAITSRLYVHSAEGPLREAAEMLNQLFTG